MIEVGLDEVGRGCWAGPLVAGAVVLGEPVAGLKDSKKLTKRQRQKLSEQILAKAASFGLGWVQPQEIDEFGLTKSVELAMRRAFSLISVDVSRIIIDGNINFFTDDSRATAIIKADEFIPSVSAASIIAKVARDNWMSSKAATDYPMYHFDKHVGYGTKLHLEMLQVYGVSEIHRRSFKPIQNFLV